MKIGLSMVVKDEVKNLSSNLAPIYDLFDSVVILDTGSRDGTIELLKESYGIDVIKYTRPEGDPLNIVDARNVSVQENHSEWLMILDADEKISRLDLKKLIDLSPPQESDGLFLKWMDHRHGEPFEDYKLFVFRNNIGIQMLGNAHSVPQTCIRKLKKNALWVENVEVHHFQDLKKTKHRSSYDTYCRLGKIEDPTWIRYDWFQGYTHFINQEINLAKPYLTEAANSLSTEFPVECLNANMVLIEIAATEGNIEHGVYLTNQALKFLNKVKKDFEVAINFRIENWFKQALQLLKSESNHKVRAYKFAY